MRLLAARVLGQCGQQEKASGTNQVAQLVLLELTGQKEPFALTAFQRHTRADNGFADPRTRRELAQLLADQPGDTPRQKALRNVLFRLVWNHCAITA